MSSEGTMRINHVAVAGVVAASLIAGATLTLAKSASKPLGKMTCQDFLAIDDTVKPKVVYWAVAYAKGGKPQAAVLDIEGTDKRQGAGRAGWKRRHDSQVVLIA
jgi:HdeA/HdeB family